MSTVASLWQTLRDAGIVDGDLPDLEPQDSPWYVKVLLGFSGWLAALFLLGFLGTGFALIFDSRPVTLVVGALMITAAWYLLTSAKNEFLEHLALAISLAGQSVVVWSIYDMTHRTDAIAWLMIGLLQGALAIFMPNFLHRVISAFGATIAYYMLLRALALSSFFEGTALFAGACLWLNEFRFPRHMSHVRAIGYGVVLALLIVKGTMLLGGAHVRLLLTGDQYQSQLYLWIDNLLTGIVALYIVWQLLRRQSEALSSRLSIGALAATVLLALAATQADGITLGLMILLIGFSGSNAVLLGIGIASLLFYSATYYYLLDATLLAKSQTLLILGFTLLAVRWLAARYFSANKEANHA